MLTLRLIINGVYCLNIHRSDFHGGFFEGVVIAFPLIPHKPPSIPCPPACGPVLAVEVGVMAGVEPELMKYCFQMNIVVFVTLVHLIMSHTQWTHQSCIDIDIWFHS